MKDRVGWGKILSRVFVEEIPEEFVDHITIQLKDGTMIDVQDEEELFRTMELLAFESEEEPIETLVINIDYGQVKKIVEQEIHDLLDPIMKGKGKEKE